MAFHFIRKRKYFYILSLLIIIPGLVSLSIQGLNLGIDFTGGNIIEVQFEQPVATEEIRDVLANQDLEQSVIQLSGENQVLLRTTVISQDENQLLMTNLEQDLGSFNILRNEVVGPVIGAELAQRALMALVVAAVIMVAYISWRFEFRQGLAAVVALIHDSLIILSVFSILSLQVDSAFVAAILTVLGYSINATIVLFDRVREKRKEAKRSADLGNLVNESIWETLTRSVNTSLTLLFMLLALYFLGGATLKTFVLALIIGVISGTYSSIFISSQIWLDLQRKFPKKKQAVDAKNKPAEV